MKFIGIIPARYASTRFPGKPLADMKGKYMIQRVYEQVKTVLDRVYVATDDRRIFDAVHSFGGKAVMTSENHKSGTDRWRVRYRDTPGKKQRGLHRLRNHERGMWENCRKRIDMYALSDDKG